MNYRSFGSTGMQVSEVGFGAWAIGGKSYGKVDKQESLNALAKAEELGCNFVDTAMVYGDSEIVLGEFLKGRRDKWLIATKFSGSSEKSLLETANEQLKRLKTDYIDFYQIHWAPKGAQNYLYDELYKLKEQGKTRYIGVSLYSASDMDFVLNNTEIDGFQIPFSLLDPWPYLQRIDLVREKKPGVIVRSALKMGFLTGKFNLDSVFPDINDQRSKLSKKEIKSLVKQADRFRFLENDFTPLSVAAARYPLSIPETSIVILGTKTVNQAETNFGKVPTVILDDAELNKIFTVQKELELFSPKYIRRILKAIFNRIKNFSD